MTIFESDRLMPACTYYLNCYWRDENYNWTSLPGDDYEEIVLENECNFSELLELARAKEGKILEWWRACEEERPSKEKVYGYKIMLSGKNLESIEI